MKKNVFLNLLYCGLLGLVGIVNLIIACVIGDKGELFFLVFCSMLALLLLHAGEIRKLIVEYSNYTLNKVVLLILKLAGIIGKFLCMILGVVGIAMGLYTIGSNHQNYGFNTEEYQMMLIGFSLIITLLLNGAMKKVDMILPNKETNSIFVYFENYGYMTLFPVVLGLNYLFALFTMSFFVNMFILSGLLIIYAIAYRHKAEEMVKHEKFNKVMSWIVIAIPVVISLALAGSVGIFNAGYDSLDSLTKFGSILYSSMILYPCVAFVLFMCLYFMTNKILYKKNKEVSMLGYVLVPLISFAVQILIFYYWYVGLIVLAVVWIVLTILGLGLEVFSCSTSGSSNPLPKYNSTKYNYKSEMEKQMSYLQSIHTQIHGWNVKEIQGKLVIEIVCKMPDAKYIEGILREYFTNEIRFLYV